jgi:hypothetical protein
VRPYAGTMQQFGTTVAGVSAPGTCSEDDDGASEHARYQRRQFNEGGAGGGEMPKDLTTTGLAFQNATFPLTMTLALTPLYSTAEK